MACLFRLDPTIGTAGIADPRRPARRLCKGAEYTRRPCRSKRPGDGISGLFQAFGGSHRAARWSPKALKWNDNLPFLTAWACSGTSAPGRLRGISMSWAYVFPGQGSQAVGMAKEFGQAFAEAREVFGEVDEALS